jgi:hypothetical protein
MQTYDDYPVIVMMQFEDLGFCAKGEGPDFVRAHDLTHAGDFPRTPAAASSRRAGGRGGRLHRPDRDHPPAHGQAGARAVADARWAWWRLRHGHLRPLPVHRRRDPGGRA